MDTAPEKFTDEDLLLAFEEPDSARNSYLPMCGVLMKLRSGLLRITRRSKLRKVFATQKKNNIKRSYHMIDDEVVNSDNSIVERDTNSNSNDNSDSNSNSNSCSVDNSFGSKTDKKDNSQLYDDADYSVENSKLLYYLFEKFVCNSEKELESWTPLTLWITSMELTMKGTNLSPDLFKEFLHQRLLPRDSNNRLTFNESFLYRVKQYHNTVKRPEGTFDVEEDELFSKLAGLDRQVCQQCQSRHQVYCGPCGGILLPNAREVIPNTNIVLPFKVKLLFHWQESYHKCTGVHVKALCAENTLEIVQWPKDKPGGNDWRLVVESLDPDRDVVLFPYESATPAKQFNWNKATPDSSGSFENKIDETGKWRLVVLEGAWNAGKTMAKQIVDHRNKVGLPPLHCVILTDVIGEYWRFQANGHSAVSTIEAIAHAAREAGLSPSEHKDLLLLFRLQKYRVLTNVKVGAKIPKAISVQGSGPGSWEEYTKDIVIN